MSPSPRTGEILPVGPTLGAEIIRLGHLKRCFQLTNSCSVVCLLGSPLAGKSTLLRQIRQAYQKDSVRCVDFKEYQQLDEHHKREPLFIFIDDYENVASAKSLLENLLSKPGIHKLIFTSTQIPKIDPILLCDLGILQVENFDERETSAFLDSFFTRVPLTPKARSFIKTHCTQVTKANPAKLRLLAGSLLNSEFGQNTKEIEGIISDSNKLFAERFFDRLPESEQRVLLQCSLIKYSDELLTQLIGSLPKESQLHLKFFGLLVEGKSKNSQTQLSKDLQQFLSNRLASNPNLVQRERSALIALIGGVQNASHLKERVHQLTALERKNEALEELENHLQEILRASNFEDVIALSDKFWREISLPKFEMRRVALLETLNFVQALDESQWRWQNESDTKNKHNLGMTIGRLQFWLGDPRQALETIEASISELPVDSSEKKFISIIKARIMKLLNPNEAYRLIKELANAVSKERDIPLAQQLEALFERAACSHFMGYYLEASELYRLVIRMAEQSNSPYLLVARFNLCDVQLRLGNIESERESFSEIRRQTEATGRGTLIDYVTSTRIRLSFWAGKHSNAENLWFESFKIPDQIENLSQYDQIHLLVQIYLFGGKFCQAESLIDLMLIRSRLGTEAYHGRVFNEYYRELLSTTKSQPLFLKFLSRLRLPFKEPLQTYDRLELLYFSLELAWQCSFKLTDEELIFQCEDLDQLPLNNIRRFLDIMRELFRSEDSNFDGIKGVESILEWAIQSDLPLWEWRAKAILIRSYCLKGLNSKAEIFLKSCVEIAKSVDLPMRDRDLLKELYQIVFKCPLKLNALRQNQDEDTVLKIEESKGAIQVNQEQIYLEKNELLFKLLLILANDKNKHKSKEQIVRDLWRENYNPLIHDTRIYTSIKRLRRLLSASLGEGFIKSTAEGYILNSQIRIQIRP